jgi:hypothetical protein
VLSVTRNGYVAKCATATGERAQQGFAYRHEYGGVEEWLGHDLLSIEN